MQLEALLKEFMLEIRIRNYTEKTIKGYNGNCSRFIHFVKEEFGVTELEEVNHIHIKQYFKLLQQKKRSEIYINTILKNIRSLFEYGISEGYCNNNPCKKVKWLTVPYYQC